MFSKDAWGVARSVSLCDHVALDPSLLIVDCLTVFTYSCSILILQNLFKSHFKKAIIKSIKNNIKNNDYKILRQLKALNIWFQTESEFRFVRKIAR